MANLRVLIVDDHRVVRQGLELFLAAEPDLELVGGAGNGREALEALARTPADVVLMDLLMPVMGGIEAIPRIRERHPEVEVIALTSVLEDRLVHQAIEAGASGYLLKDTGARELAEAIRAVARGEVRLHPEAARRLATEVRTPDMRESLTPREVQTLRLLANGASNKEIARELDISDLTVKVHVSHLLSKLDLKSRLQAAIFAHREGLVDWSGPTLHDGRA